MSNLGNQLVIAERDDIARGIRLLLATPLISERADPDGFELVLRRQGPLAKWFDYYCGWTLVVEPRFGYARLSKIRNEHDATRPARRPRSGRAPFDRRRYALLCVVAAELLSGPATTIGLLADRVKQATAADAVVGGFDTATRGERMAYVDVLRLLESRGVLVAVDGATESFVESQDAKVLYQVDTTLLLRLLSAPNGASTRAVPAEEVGLRWPALLDGLVSQHRYGAGEDSVSDSQRNLWLRHSILRRLFDDPVVYRDSLSEAERNYLASPTGRQILHRAADQAGFVLEEREEGYLLVDPDAIATDRKFPDDSSTAGVAALLMLDALVPAPGGLTDEQLRAQARDLLHRFPRWAKTYRDEDGVLRLVDDAIAVLESFDLAERTATGVRARPAAARYSVAEIRTSQEGR